MPLDADGEKQLGETEESRRSSLQHSLALQSGELRKNLRRPLGSMQVALRQKLTLSFPHFQSFVAQCSPNVSMTGMFVSSETPASPETLVDFEIRLIDGLSLIHGQAEVVWVRRIRREANRPVGMGLRFLRLDPESRRLIRWLVEKHLEEEGSLVDLEELSKTSLDLDLGKLYPYAGVGIAGPKRLKMSPSTTRRWRRNGLIAAAVLVVLVAGGLLQWSGRTALSREADLAPAFTAQVRPTGAIEVSEGRLFETVEAWIRESSGGEHSDGFLDLQRAWETSFQSPQSPGSKLETTVKAEFLGAERARVSYLRRHVTEAGEDTVQTALDLGLEDGRWRVLEEVKQQRTTAAAPEEPAAIDAFVQRSGRIEVFRPLSIRGEQPTTGARRVRVILPGTVLDYVGWTTGGEAVNGNAHWYKDHDGNYFWAGGTAVVQP